MKLKDLLEQWSQLEPDRCIFSVESENEEAWYTVVFDTGKAHIEFMRATQEDHALLQSAVQKMVEMRGWMWSILYSSHRTYRAGIKIEGRYISETAPYPAYALLAAYIKALEAIV